MIGAIAIRGAVLAIVIGAFYQLYLREFVQLLGIGRQLRTLDEFPYQCRRVNDPDLEACEDMWYNTNTKQIYLACSKTVARRTWLPNMGRFKAPSSDETERVVVLDIDKPTGDTFQHQILSMKSFKSAYHSLAITGKHDDLSPSSSSKIKLYLVNNKPTLDSTGSSTDNSKTGAHTTIELFEHTPGSKDLVHLRTFAHALIATPNNIAIAKDGGIFFTNDHGLHKHGLGHESSTALFTGNIAHCKPSTPTECTILSTSHSFPNGIIIPESHPNLLFVASAAFGGAIRIYDITPSPTGHPTLKLKQKIPLDLPVDNLTYDPVSKSIYAAGIPHAWQTMKNLNNETCDHLVSAGGSVLRIYEEKNLVDGARWVAETVLEDPNGLVLPGITTALRDGNGAIWTSGILSPFVAVCEPKRIGA